MPIQETFHGFIETTTDALLIFEACRRGVLPKINRRLQERERSAVRSGTVFVFDEKESGIKRWTDGIVWSPSRILGNFLVYRELDGRESLQQQPYDEEEYMTMEDRNRERALVGSLTDTYRFRKDGLIKKTLSIHLNNSFQHLVSYYTKQDVLDKCLVTPSSIPDIGAIRLSPDLLLRQSFRVPPSVEYNDSSLSPTSSSSSCCSTPPSSVVARKPLLDEVNMAATRRRGIETVEGYNNNPLSRKIARLSMDFNNHKSAFIEPPPRDGANQDNTSAFKIIKQILLSSNNNVSLLGPTHRESFNPFMTDIRQEKNSTPWSPLERNYPICNKLISAYDPCASVDQHPSSTNYHHFQNNHHFH